MDNEEYFSQFSDVDTVSCKTNLNLLAKKYYLSGHS